MLLKESGDGLHRYMKSTEKGKRIKFKRNQLLVWRMRVKKKARCVAEEKDKYTPSAWVVLLLKKIRKVRK